MPTCLLGPPPLQWPCVREHAHSPGSSWRLRPAQGSAGSHQHPRARRADGVQKSICAHKGAAQSASKSTSLGVRVTANILELKSPPRCSS